MKRDVLSIVKGNGGIITASAAKGLGILPGTLKFLTDKGKLNRLSRGVYALPDACEDDFTALQSRFKRGIFSGATALYLWGLTDRTPEVFEMTFPFGYNLSEVKRSGLLAHQAIHCFYGVGKTETSTPQGQRVALYSRERTLCDLLRPKRNYDVQLVADAFKGYMRLPERNIALLSKIAEQFNVSAKMRNYMEVLA